VNAGPEPYAAQEVDGRQEVEGEQEL
jgi:hypothetical protein